MPPSTQPAIETRGLTKNYGRRVALDDVSFTVQPGEVLGYLGPNGAGKTTTLRLLLGLISPSAGQAFLFGVDCAKEPARAHARVAYVPGEANLWPNLTGAETLDLLGSVHPGVDASYRHELIERFAVDPGLKVRACSKGNRQKLLLVAALMTRADLLLLDEPTSGLDPLMQHEFRACIREATSRGQAVLLSSHVLSEVEEATDRVAILRDGRLIESGTLADLRHLSVTVVTATYGGPPPKLENVPGITDLAVRGSTVTCHVHGPMDAALRALTSAPVLRLSTREPSLEELFLAHYDRVDPAQAA